MKVFYHVLIYLLVRKREDFLVILRCAQNLLHISCEVDLIDADLYNAEDPSLSFRMTAFLTLFLTHLTTYGYKVSILKRVPFCGVPVLFSPVLQTVMWLL